MLFAFIHYMRTICVDIDRFMLQFHMLERYYYGRTDAQMYHRDTILCLLLNRSFACVRC